MEYTKQRIVKKEIPDNDPNGLVDRINVVRNLTIKSVDVSVNIHHPYSGDISIELSGPNGKKVTLHSPTRVPGKNIKKNFNGDMLSVFEGAKSKGEWSLKVVDSGARDDGKLNDWSLHLVLANSKKSEIFIDDNQDLDSVQVCHQGGKIVAISADVNIEHSHIGDLVCKLVAPSGKSVVLHNKTGGSTNNLVKSFSENDLKEMNGEVAKGKWHLEVSDTLKGDAGKVKSWKLNIKTSNAKPNVKEDLTKIEGIGPKIKELLWNGGILSFSQLANSSPASIKKILEAAGPRYQMHDPGSWPRQASLAASGKWKELEKLQDELDGGK